MKRQLSYLAFATLFLISCTGRNNKGGTALPVLTQIGGGTSSTSTTTTAGVTTTTTEDKCSGATATIERLSNSQQVYRGDNIAFKITAQGCANFKLVRAGVTISFTSVVYYTKSFSTDGNGTIETVTIIPVSASGDGTAISLTTAPFNVVPPLENQLTCSLTPASQTADVHVSYEGLRIDPWPRFNFSVSSNATRGIQLTSLQNMSGTLGELPSIPSNPNSVSFTVTSYGANQLIAFQVEEAADANYAARRATCYATVAVNKIEDAPAAPTCQLTASSSQVALGSNLNLTVVPHGYVTNINIAGTTLAPLQFTTTVIPTAVSTVDAVATVTGPAPWFRTGTCSVRYIVISPKQQCMTGYYYWSKGHEYYNRAMGWIFIGALPTDFQTNLQSYLNSCTSSCGGGCNAALFNSKLAPYARLAVQVFQDNAPATYDYSGYTYAIKNGANIGTGECPNINTHPSPLIVDLEGQGVELTLPSAGVNFDMLGEGLKSKYSWPSNPKSSMFLALDSKGDGIIRDVNQLFGNNTKGPDGKAPLMGNGFDALKKHDLNNDGKIDVEDPVFLKLRLWSDRNMDGQSQPGELFTLQEKKIKSIDLNYINANETVDPYGNERKERSKAITSDGRVLSIFDYWFAAGQ